MEATKKIKQMKHKLYIFKILSFLSSIAPLVIVLAMNHDKYIKNVTDAIKLSVGCMLIIAFVALKILGKLKMPSRMVLFGVVFLMSVLFEALLSDLKFISAMALAGEFVDALLFDPKIKKIEEKIKTSKIANETAAQVENVIKQYIGRV